MNFAIYYVVGLVIMFILVLVEAKYKRKAIAEDAVFSICVCALFWPFILVFAIMMASFEALNKWIEK